MLIYNEKEHLVKMFEKIHFALFFVLVMFLCLSLGVLLSADQTTLVWQMYLDFIRNHEKVCICCLVF